jgi:hypothetical protein
VGERKGPYLAYLLRLWQVRDEGQAGWRASLENAHTSERHGFGRLADLFTFLENEVCQVVQDQQNREKEETG